MPESLHNEDMNYKIILSFAFAVPLVTLTLFASCAPLIAPSAGSDRVELTLPRDLPLPPGVAETNDILWTVSWIDGSGTRRRLSGVRERCAIALERGIVTAVLARPDVSVLGAPELAASPVGAVYPADARVTPFSVSLVLDGTGAVAAQALETILSTARADRDEARTLASRINWKKFRARSASLETPGLTDLARFASAALSGRITGSSVSTRPAKVLAVRSARGVPAAGSTLVPEWAGGRRERWSEGAETPLLLPDGITRFLGDDGWLTVSVSDGGVICAYYEYYVLRE